MIQNQNNIRSVEETFGKDNAFLPKDRRECEDSLDHQPQWCGDCYACARCGTTFVSVPTAKSRTSSLLTHVKIQIATGRFPQGTPAEWESGYNAAKDEDISLIDSLIHPKI